MNMPITPNMNINPSKAKIVLEKMYPSLKNNEIINGNNGGLNKSEYPMP